MSLWSRIKDPKSNLILYESLVTIYKGPNCFWMYAYRHWTIDLFTASQSCTVRFWVCMERIIKVKFINEKPVERLSL